jgi:hypothetical protein
MSWFLSRRQFGKGLLAGLLGFLTRKHASAAPNGAAAALPMPKPSEPLAPLLDPGPSLNCMTFVYDAQSHLCWTESASIVTYTYDAYRPDAEGGGTANWPE